MWATTIGAVLGPNIAAPAGRSVPGHRDTRDGGPLPWAAGIFLVAAVVVAVLLRPDPLLTARALAPDEDTVDAASRSLRAGVAAVRASPRARLALVTVAVSPHRDGLGHGHDPGRIWGTTGRDIELIGLVISGHIAGMYAFSPLDGVALRPGRAAVRDRAGGGAAVLRRVARRYGGAGSHGRIARGCSSWAWAGRRAWSSGSALLTDSVPQAARAAVQGLSDLTMNTSAGIGGAVAGAGRLPAGYGWLNLAAACLLLPMAALALLTRSRGVSDVPRRVAGRPSR